MKLSKLLISFTCVALSSIALGQILLPDPPALKARGYILMDGESKRILAESNAKEKFAPASLTKIMTSYVAASEIAAERITLDEMVNVSVNAWKTPGSKTFIREGTEVSVSDLLRGIIIQSGNDASVALAEYIAGDEEEFARLMNRYGEEIGLEGTHFMNSTGLPHPDHLSTAYDNALLARALIYDYPEHYKMYSELEFTYADITQPNRNRLLTLDPTVDGVKTGFTEDAGYCLVTSSVKNGMRLIAVVMGTDSNDTRIRETRKLLSYGFRNFEKRSVLDENFQFDTIKVLDGTQDRLEVEIRESVVQLLPRGSRDNQVYEINLPDPLIAPIKENDVVGTLRVVLNDEELAITNLYAKHEVKKIGFFAGMWEGIKGWFSSVPEDETSGPQTFKVDPSRNTEE